MSQFEDLPLPVSRDAQDYSRLVPANSTVEIPVVGEFVYCKFSDGSIRVVINGKSTLMESGDERRSGGSTVFRGVTLINDTDVAKSIIFVIGFGGFDRKIIQGNIGIEPILVSADGSTKPDTRRSVRIDLTPSNLALTTFQAGDVINQAATPRADDNTIFKVNSRGTRGPGNLFTLMNFDGAGGIDLTFISYNSDMVEVDRSLVSPSYPSVSNNDMTYRAGFGYYFVDNGGTGFNSLFLLTPTEFVNIKNFSDLFSSAEWMPERNQWALGMQSVGIEIWDADLENLLFTIPNTSNLQNSLNYDPFNDWIIIGASDDAIAIDFTGATRATFAEPGLPAGTTSRGLMTIDGKSMTLNGGSSGQTPLIAKTAWREFTTKPEFIARQPGCDFAGAFIKPGIIPQITADISFEVLPNGVSLSGELIKAAIEYYYKRAAPEDYLDHIYQADFSSDAAGNPSIATNTGNRSFAAAFIADDFGILTPGTIVLNLDNELELGGLL